MNKARPSDRHPAEDSRRFATLRGLGMLLLILPATIALLVLAWANMNAGTFLCFCVIIGWIVYPDFVHYRLTDLFELTDKRLWALEEHAGIARAYFEEVTNARRFQTWFGGGVADHVFWPKTDDMARWRRLHWANWSSQHEAVEADLATELDSLWDSRPFVPPPDTDDEEVRLAYWSDRTQWQAERTNDLDDWPQ